MKFSISVLVSAAIFLAIPFASASDTFSISINTSNGQSIVQGDDTQFTATATVSGVDSKLAKNTKYSTECTYDGTIISTEGPKKVSLGDAFSCKKFDTGQFLVPGSHSFTMKVYEVLASGSTSMVASQISVLAVTENTVSPVWTVNSPVLPLSNFYMKKMPEFQATLSISQGVIDQPSIVILLDSDDVTSQLKKSSPDKGTKYKTTIVERGNLNPDLAEGLHTITLSQGKNIGGKNATPVSFSFYIDKTKPVLSIAGSTITKSNVKTVLEILTLNLAVTEASGHATTTVTNNGSVVFTTASLFAPAPIELVAGVNDLVVTCVDSAGNVASPINLKHVVFDGVVPQILSLTPLNGTLLNTRLVNVVGSTSTPVTSVLANSTAMAISAGGLSFSGTVLLPADGTQTINVVTKNSQGNSASQSISVVVDTVPPVVTLSANVSALTNQKSAQFTFASNKANSTFSCALDGAQPSTCSSPASFTGLSSTGHTFTVLATDLAHNKSAPAQFGWNIDTTPPVLSNISPAANSSLTSLTGTVSATSSKPLGTATANGSMATLDVSKTLISAQVTYSGYGPQAIIISATDLAGNQAIVNVPITITLPPLTLSFTPVSGTVLTSRLVQITGTANKTLNTTQVNGQPLQVMGSSFSGVFTASADGMLVLNISAVATDGTTANANSVVQITTMMGSNFPSECQNSALTCQTYTGDQPIPSNCLVDHGTLVCKSLPPECSSPYASCQPYTGQPIPGQCLVDGTTLVCSNHSMPPECMGGTVSCSPYAGQTVPTNCLVDGSYLVCSTNNQPQICNSNTVSCQKYSGQTVPPNCLIESGTLVCASGLSQSPAECSAAGLSCTPFAAGQTVASNCLLDGSTLVCTSTTADSSTNSGMMGMPSECMMVLPGVKCQPYATGQVVPSGCIVDSGTLVCATGGNGGGLPQECMFGSSPFSCTPYVGQAVNSSCFQDDSTWVCLMPQECNANGVSCTPYNGGAVAANCLVDGASAVCMQLGQPSECSASGLQCTAYNGQSVGPACFVDKQTLVCSSNGGGSGTLAAECQSTGLSCTPYAGQAANLGCFVDGLSFVCASDGGGPGPLECSASGLKCTAYSGQAQTPSCYVSGQSLVCASSGGGSSTPAECAAPGLSCVPYNYQAHASSCFQDGNMWVCASDGGGAPPECSVVGLSCTPYIAGQSVASNCFVDGPSLVCGTGSTGGGYPTECQSPEIVCQPMSPTGSIPRNCLVDGSTVVCNGDPVEISSLVTINSPKTGATVFGPAVSVSITSKIQLGQASANSTPLQISSDQLSAFGSITLSLPGPQDISIFVSTVDGGTSRQHTFVNNILPPPDCSIAGATCTAVLPGNPVPQPLALGCALEGNFVVCLPDCMLPGATCAQYSGLPPTSSVLPSRCTIEGRFIVCTPQPPSGPAVVPTPPSMPPNGYFVQTANISFVSPDATCPAGLSCFSFSGSPTPSGCIQLTSNQIACGSSNAFGGQSTTGVAQLDEFRVTGSIDPNVAFGNSDFVSISLGTFTIAIPISSFSVSGKVYTFSDGNYVFSPQAPQLRPAMPGQAGLESFVMDLGAGTFSARLSQTGILSLTNPVQINVSLGSFSRCAMLGFNEVNKPWTFNSITNGQYECLSNTRASLGRAGVFTNESTSVLATVQVTQQIDVGSLQLVAVDSNLNPIGTPFCTLADDGNAAIDGDTLANDGIYSCLTQILQTSPGKIGIMAQATIQGRQALSPFLNFMVADHWNQSQIHEIVSIGGSLASALSNSVAQNGYTQSGFAQLKNSISALGGINQVYVDEQNHEISVIDKYGVERTIIFADPALGRLGGGALAGTGRTFSPDSLLGGSPPAWTPPSMHVPNSNVLIWSAFQDDFSGTDPADVLPQLFQPGPSCSEFHVNKSLLNQTATYANLKAELMNNYGTIVLSTHGSFRPTVCDSNGNCAPKHWKFATRDIPTASTIAELETDMHLNKTLTTIIVDRKSGSMMPTEEHLAFTQDTIRMLPGKFQNGTVVLLWACEGLKTDGFSVIPDSAQAFLDKGAATVFGWDAEFSAVSDARANVMIDLFSNLVRRQLNDRDAFDAMPMTSFTEITFSAPITSYPANFRHYSNVGLTTGYDLKPKTQISYSGPSGTGKVIDNKTLVLNVEPEDFANGDVKFNISTSDCSYFYPETRYFSGTPFSPISPDALDPQDWLINACVGETDRSMSDTSPSVSGPIPGGGSREITLLPSMFATTNTNFTSVFQIGPAYGSFSGDAAPLTVNLAVGPQFNYILGDPVVPYTGALNFGSQSWATPGAWPTKLVRVVNPNGVPLRLAIVPNQTWIVVNSKQTKDISSDGLQGLDLGPYEFAELSISVAPKSLSTAYRGETYKGQIQMRAVDNDSLSMGPAIDVFFAITQPDCSSNPPVLLGVETIGPTIIEKGKSVYLVATQICCGDGNNFSWSFSDGNNPSGKISELAHTFNTPGLNTVTFTSTSKDCPTGSGNPASLTASIFVVDGDLTQTIIPSNFVVATGTENPPITLTTAMPSALDWTATGYFCKDPIWGLNGSINTYNQRERW